MRICCDEIPVQTGGLSRAASNVANVMLISRGGLATGIVAIPNRYMHSPVEMISLSDIDRAADLLAAFALSLDGTETFTP